MKRTPELTGARRRTCAPTRLLSLLVAGLVLVAGLFTHALQTAPSASALTQQEAKYVSMLAEKGILPAGTYEDLALGGQLIAYDLRQGANPVDEAYTVWKASGSLTFDQATWEVACALVVFAPELVPIYTDGSPPGDMAV